MSTIPQPPEGGEHGQQHADWITDSLGTDSLADHLEYRVAALEEVTAARWPRRWLLAAVLGRQLRGSVRHFPGRSFADRRAEAASADWLAQQPPPGATPAPVSTAVARDGSATIAAADLGLVLGALADAAMCHLAHGGDRILVPAYRRISLALGDDRG